MMCICSGVVTLKDCSHNNMQVGMHSHATVYIQPVNLTNETDYYDIMHICLHMV